MVRTLFLTLALTVAAFAGELKSPAVGTEAPMFSLSNYDGKAYDLGKVIKSNKATVVMFISTNCPVSNAYNERMEQLYEKYHEKGVAVIAVNSNKAEDIKAIAEHAKDHGFRFPVVKDPGNKVADLYGAQVTPEAYVIAPDGKLLYHGRIDDNRNAAKVTSSDLAGSLDNILAGKKVTATSLRAFGCSIKRMSEE